jgi:hypothetical protein
MLRRDLAGAVLKLPRRIGENGAEALTPRRGEQLDRGFRNGLVGGEYNRIVLTSKVLARVKLH